MSTLDIVLFESILIKLSRHAVISKTCLLVHPVIFLLTDPASVLPQLVPCPTEVSSMWSFPMQLFLRSTLPPNMELPLSEPETIDTHREPQEAFRTYSDVPWLNSQHYRLHRFRTHRQLIKGLTADILIDAAQIVYGQPARYQLYAPDQPPWREGAQHILQQEKGKRLSRWGDGESGDLLTSAHAFATVIGVDDLDTVENGGEHVVQQA